MKELEQIKNESKKKLIQQGYTEEEAEKTECIATELHHFATMEI